jgi:acyl-CoA synthetase (AMP-forming)/AMP-acid ligase II
MVANVTFPDDFNLARYFLFDRIAEGLGPKVAIRYGNRSYTYELVAQRSRAFAALLEDVGVRRGERVLIVLPDTPPFAWVFFGTLARGAVVAMGNPDATIEQIEYLVGYTRATAVVTVPRIAEALREAKRRGLGREVLRIWEVPETKTGEDPEIGELAAALGIVDASRDPVPIHRDEPSIWLFTSGSTGEPKANVHTHRDFAFNTEVYAKRTVGYALDDVTISVPRLFFGYATGTNLMFPFAVGATVGRVSGRPTGERQTAARSLVRSLLALRRRSLARSAPHAMARSLPQRRLRRYRLGRDVPHLCIEPPRRREARIARQGRRRLRASHPARGRRRSRRDAVRARRNRRALGQRRQRVVRLLARSRQELEDVPRPLVPDRRSL